MFRFIGLVQQPGWLLHKSRRCGGFLAEIRRICCFFSGSCSITEVIEQLYQCYLVLILKMFQSPRILCRRLIMAPPTGSVAFLPAPRRLYPRLGAIPGRSVPPGDTGAARRMRPKQADQHSHGFTLSYTRAAFLRR
jgi:hypothetical protein